MIELYSPFFCLNVRGRLQEYVNVPRILTHSDAHLLDDCAPIAFAFAAAHLSSSKPSCAIGDSFCLRLPT
jgi:hypothetical protein